ncbi:DUF1569 domain-containing protein [Neorhodopirellula pilleata]|uniref:DUF1569 domain-containing protein n=1 Tax=Neorhodopirellula pilleata TaxID=2714738 RepID=UPI0036F33CFB
MPESVRARLEPPADADFETQKARLLESIVRFQDFDGEHPPHPVLGTLTREQMMHLPSHHTTSIKSGTRTDREQSMHEKIDKAAKS